MFVLLDCMIFSFHLRWTKNVYQSVCYLPHVWCIHIRCDITWTNSCALVRANPGPKGNVLIGENTVSFPYIRCTQLTCWWYWRYCISERFFRQQWTGMPVHGTAPVRHRSTEIAIWKMELKQYYSFTIFPRFWLAKSIRMIYHNQLLMTKFWRILKLINRRSQKCSFLAG